MAVGAQKGRFHTLEIRAGELGLLSVTGREMKHQAEKLRQLFGLLGVGGVDAYVHQLERVIHGWSFYRVVGKAPATEGWRASFEKRQTAAAF